MLRLRLLTATVSGSQASTSRSKFARAVGVEGDLGLERRVVGDSRVDRHAEARGGVERVDHVQIVGPGLGEVLPGVHGRIGADVALLPAGRRAVLVVPLAAPPGSRSLSSPKTARARLDLAAVAHQHVPVVVADLVAQVAEQRPVGLAELQPPPLALGGIGLGDVDGDQPVVVAGHHRLARVGVGEEVEGEAFGRVLLLARERQAEAASAHRSAGAWPPRAPASARGCRAPTRSGMVRLSVAGRAEVVARPAGTIQLQSASFRFGALAPARRRRPARSTASPAASRSSAESVSGVGQEAERHAAAHADDVLEMQQLPAVLAGEDLHACSFARGRARGRRFGGRTPPAARVASRMQNFVDEADLLEHVRARVERVEVGLAHAAVEAVDRRGQRQPGAASGSRGRAAGRGRSRSPPRGAGPRRPAG